ncbi:MAG: hypothetical protein M1490_03760 [Candidatus Bathyarchaeota archaeon]|nr:hypothetical protein [Candidatus Bathyarchaeota archaeon]
MNKQINDSQLLAAANGAFGYLSFAKIRRGGVTLVFSLVVVAGKVAKHNNFQQVALLVAFCRLGWVWVAGWLCRQPQAEQKRLGNQQKPNLHIKNNQ